MEAEDDASESAFGSDTDFIGEVTTWGAVNATKTSLSACLHSLVNVFKQRGHASTPSLATLLRVDWRELAMLAFDMINLLLLFYRPHTSCWILAVLCHVPCCLQLFCRSRSCGVPEACVRLCIQPNPKDYNRRAKG